MPIFGKQDGASELQQFCRSRLGLRGQAVNMLLCFSFLRYDGRRFDSYYLLKKI
jgi:hypothetical protein